MAGRGRRGLAKLPAYIIQKPLHLICRMMMSESNRIIESNTCNRIGLDLSFFCCVDEWYGRSNVAAYGQNQ